MPSRANRQTTTVTAPAVDTLVKVVKVERTDTTAFDAFVLPKGCVIAGAYVLGGVASNAATTATIDVGTNPGTADEIVDGFDVITNGKGYSAVGTAAGTAFGSQLTADTKYKARYTETGTASTTGGPWYVKVEYYFPQQGESY